MLILAQTRGCSARGCSARGSARDCSARGSARGCSARGSARDCSARGSARDCSARGSARDCSARGSARDCSARGGYSGHVTVWLQVCNYNMLAKQYGPPVFNKGSLTILDLLCGKLQHCLTTESVHR